VEEVESLFMAEIDRIGAEGVEDEEVEKAKRQLEVSLIRGLRTTHSLADRIGRDFVTFGRVRPLEERLAAIQRVTAVDVQRVVQTYLVPDKRSVVHVVPPDARDELLAGAAEDAAPAASGPSDAAQEEE
jgi:zinc protease